MAMPDGNYHNEIMGEMGENWKKFIDSLEKSLNDLEKDIEEVSEMQSTCTSEWCEATEHVLDELSNSIFSISEPRWASKQMGDKIKQLKKRTHELYSNYKVVSAK